MAGETNRKRPTRRTLRSLELFTGAGGLALGTHEAGFRHAALVEWNRDACETVRANVSLASLPGITRWRVLEEDIRQIQHNDFENIQLVAGGPPCQPFSIGGKHRGMLDERDMIPEFIRSVRELQPAAFILENVKGLTRQTFRNYFSYIKLQLTYPANRRKKNEDWLEHLARLEDIHTKGRYRGLNYNVVSRLLNSANYGVPQTRERVFVVGFRADLGIEWHFPEPTHSKERLIYDQRVSGEYWDQHGIHSPGDLLNAAHSRPSPPVKPQGKAWRTVRDAIHDLPAPQLNRESAGVFNHRLQPGARAYVGHTGSPLDWPSKTLKAGVHGVPGGENMIAFPDGRVRYYSVREAARVQTFPDDWRFFGSWSEVMRQLGNAVPMHLATTVAKSVAASLRKAHDSGKTL